MKKVYYSFVLLTFFLGGLFAQGQQLPNSNCNDWSGPKFKDEIQPAGWNYSNVIQTVLGAEVKFNFAHREAGRSGQSGDYSMMVQDQDLEVAGIGETSPGYIALGQPWAYLEGLNVNSATAGTYGGLAWNSRPDTLSVWIRRTGDHWRDENYNILYYAWKGTAQGSSYKNKGNGCTSISRTDEESDIRIALDGNECQTKTRATQICEGWVWERKEYPNWTNIRIPIYYMNNEVPEKMNVILSASNYPNFRANNGLYAGNSLYVDDMELIYSASIQQLVIDDRIWEEFNPSTDEVQVYELGRDATSIPKIEAKRGIGSLTNPTGGKADFPGRVLSGKEISIEKGAIGDITRIVVKSEDGKRSKTYSIRFVREASANTQLDGIAVNGQPIEKFNPKVLTYDYALPFGSVEKPIVTCTKHEEEQVVQIMQAASQTGTATILVTAANGRNTATYTINFSVEELKDNTLLNILVNGQSIPGFLPTRTSYRVSLPVDTETMPTVEAVSAYPEGMQTIVYTAPQQIDGGVYTIAVTTPGNPQPNTYKLTFKLEPSSYAYLKDLRMGDDQNLIEDFEPEKLTYYVSLPLGTLALPTITPIPGDAFQKVEVQYGDLNGMSRVLVTAGDGVTTNLYKINVTTATSSLTTLNAIYINGEPLHGFDPQVLSYTYDLPIGTTEMPVVTTDPGDEFQVVTITYGGLNGITRILVTAGDGSTRLYQIQFHQQVSSVNTLKDIQVDGVSLPNFHSEVTEYTYTLPAGTETLPTVTYTAGDEFQTITTRSGGVGGDYKIIVYPQQGASRTYTIHFVVETSSNTQLAMIYLDTQPLEGFEPTQREYDITLPDGVSVIPSVTVQKAETNQRVLTLLQGNQVLITVTAQSGAKATYTLNFIVHVSANAFLKAIFLDGDTIEGFAPDKLNYEVRYSETRPTLTVEPDQGQQVTIILPKESGEARILVQSQAGDVNTYQVTFIKQYHNDAVLQNIFVNQEPLTGFQPAILDYTISYEGQRPTFTWQAEESLQVTPYEQANVQMIRVSSATSTNVYTITMEQTLSSDSKLSAILIDGAALSTFVPSTKDYTIDLEAGSELPQVTFVPKNERQQLVYGPISPNASSVVVVAEDGTQSTYTVTFRTALYDLTAPLSIAVTEQEINYQPNTYIYHLSIGFGEQLPQVVVVPDKGQSVAIYNEHNSLQKVVVTAQNGDQAIYEIRYNRTKSNNAFLANILINNQSIEGFRADSFNYVDSLAWRTKVLPCVMPKGQLPTQTITTHYCAVDGVMKIEVLAEDGVTKQTYTIAFPVIKSANANLASVAFTNLNELTFNPEVTDYAFTLPYGTTAVPVLEMYEKQEPEQRVAIESRPLGEATTITVTAEKGNTKTYRFYFEAKGTEAENKLRLIQYKYTRENAPEEVITKSLMTNEQDFEVALPYGTKTFEVLYEKNYNEQVVFAQQGGILHPTILKVMANHTGYEDLTYTITPKVSEQNPAVLTDIKVNGVTIEGFDSNRFSYIVNVTSNPIATYTLNQGANINFLAVTPKHWAVEVMKDGYTNHYDLWYFYSEEQVPNADFTEWTNCATVTSCQKPTGWNTVADVLGKHSGFGSYTPDKLVQKNGNRVQLQTWYSTPGGGAVPGFITLGTVSSTGWKVAGSTPISVSGGISFHNSPDQMLIKYNFPQLDKQNGEIQYLLNGSNGNSILSWKITNETNDYKEMMYDLSQANAQVGDPAQLNIILNTYNQVTCSEQTGYLSNSVINTMNVEYVHFKYNSTLSALKVNGLDATLTDNAFAVTLPSCEQTSIPSLAFTGQVNDQAQLIEWNEEVNGVRTATIRNFAEDGTYTDYTLSVTRPLQSNAELESILVNGQVISDFDASKLDYTYTMTTAQLPDITYEPKSNLQTISMTYADSTMTIVVKAENGTQKTYTVKMVRTLSHNTSLVAIDGVDTFDPSTHTYTIVADQMPDLNFIKAEDAQTVVMKEGVFTITAQDGTKGTYTVIAQPQPRQSQGFINEFELDGVIPMDFGGTNFTKTATLPTWASFVREDNRDSVIMTQTEKQIQWQVIGTQSTKTYTLSAPAEDVTNTNLQAILVADTLLDGFNAEIKNYILVTNTDIELRALPIYAGQQVAISRANNIYSIVVTSVDGSHTATYTIKIQPDLSSIAELEMIYIDGQELTGFRADSTDYTVILPAPEYKKQELLMPAITYRSCQGAAVTVEAGALGEQTMISVTSEDETTHRYYTITVEAEPSHNANLTSILIDNQPLEHFSPAYSYYSTRVKNKDFTVNWAMSDRFVKVTRTDMDSEDNVVVMLDTKAQDDTTTRHYEVNVYVESFAANATLSDITLNGQPMSEFLPELNPMLTFSPMNNQYTINLPVGTTQLPDVQAVLGQEGQTVTYHREGWMVQLQVASKDNIETNIYTLQYVIPKSSNALLSNIFINGDALPDFAPTTFVYTYAMPLDEHSQHPEVVGQQSEITQTVSEAVFDGNKATIVVTAEDGSKAQYIILFDYQPSKVDTLKAIYQDADLLPDFVATRNEYFILLPQGERRFPNLDWDLGDPYQTAEMDTIAIDTYQLQRRITVTAQDGRQRVYGVNYEIQKSAVDTLQNIFINDKRLETFAGTVEEYSIYVDSDDQPVVSFTAGDEYQNVTVITLPEVDGVKALDKAVIMVEAENGNIRFYTIHFLLPLDNNAHLQMIYKDNQPLDNFDPDILNYTVILAKDAPLPTITWQTQTPEQQVFSSTIADTTSLLVVAEDGTLMTYKIFFQHKLSQNADLATINVNGIPMESFQSDINQYEMFIAYGKPLPVLTGVKQEPEQTITQTQDTVISLKGDSVINVHFLVQAEDITYENEYTVAITLGRNTDAHLMAIALRGTALKNFAPSVLDYQISFPVGSDTTVFYTVADVAYVLSDPKATAVVTELDHHTLQIDVLAQDQQTRNIYTVTQHILLDENNYLSDLMLDGIDMPGFTPEKDFYTYYLEEGMTPPVITAIPQSQEAKVSINAKPAGDTSVVVCEAASKAVRKYYIYFAKSPINDTQAPTSRDVLLKYVPGTTDIVVATTRKNVTFCLYDAYGHAHATYKLTTVNTNFADIDIDSDGKEHLFNFDNAMGLQIHLLPNQFYIYSFVEGGKRIIQSGKLLMH